LSDGVADRANAIYDPSQAADAISVYDGILMVYSAADLSQWCDAIGAAVATHFHGNISTAGAIGSTSGQVVVTTTGGVLTTAATISSSSVSGLAASATTDATNATNITSGTLSDSRLSTNARQSTESFIHPFLTGGL